MQRCQSRYPVHRQEIGVSALLHGAVAARVMLEGGGQSLRGDIKLAS